MASDTTLRGIGQKDSQGGSSEDKTSAKAADRKSGARPADVQPDAGFARAGGRPTGGARTTDATRATDDGRKAQAVAPGPITARSLDSTIPGTRSLDSHVPGAPPSLDAKVPNLSATLIGVAPLMRKSPVGTPISVPLSAGNRPSSAPFASASEDTSQGEVDQSNPALVAPPPRDAKDTGAKKDLHAKADKDRPKDQDDDEGSK